MTHLERVGRGARLDRDLGGLPAAEWVATHWPMYVQGREAGGHRVDPADWRVAKSLCVADDDESARRCSSTTARYPTPTSRSTTCSTGS